MHKVRVIKDQISKSQFLISGPTLYNVSDAYKFYSRKHKMTYMIHQIEIAKIHIDSTLTIEFKPTDENLMYGLLLDHERIPIPSQYEHAAIVSLKDNNFESTNATNVFWNSDYEFYEWFISNDAVNNRTGRWFLTIISMKATTTSDELNKKKLDSSLVEANITGDYSLRTFHTGCYYFNRY